MQRSGVLAQIAIAAVTYWSLSNQVRAIKIGSSDMPYQPAELSQSEVKGSFDHVGSLSQTDALSDLPIAFDDDTVERDQ